MTREPGKQRTNRDVLLRMLEIFRNGEWDALDEVLDRDVVIEYPQSGERTRGIEAQRQIMTNYPKGNVEFRPVDEVFIMGDEDRYVLTPMFTMVRIEGSGDTLVSSVKTHYPDGTDWYIVSITTFRNGKIAKEVQYFAPLFEAPAWRARWVERMEPDGS